MLRAKLSVYFRRSFTTMTPLYRSCRIGCGSGFWGDTTCAGIRSIDNLVQALVVAVAPQLVRHGNIDYLAMDYLSEITMSLLTAAKQKNPVELMIIINPHVHSVL